jgi:hypothetical protein
MDVEKGRWVLKTNRHNTLSHTMRPENVLEQQSLTILEDVGLYLQDFVASKF